jgi:hypothetical protein
VLVGERREGGRWLARSGGGRREEGGGRLGPVVAGGRREGGGGTGGRPPEQTETENLALYHVGNPKKGLGDVLID